MAARRPEATFLCQASQPSILFPTSHPAWLPGSLSHRLWLELTSLGNTHIRSLISFLGTSPGQPQRWRGWEGAILGVGQGFPAAT